GDPLFSLRRRTVVNGYLIAGFLQEARHRIAHHAEPDKCCLFRHFPTSLEFISSVIDLRRAQRKAIAWGRAPAGLKRVILPFMEQQGAVALAHMYMRDAADKHRMIAR